MWCPIVLFRTIKMLWETLWPRKTHSVKLIYRSANSNSSSHLMKSLSFRSLKKLQRAKQTTVSWLHRILNNGRWSCQTRRVGQCHWVPTALTPVKMVPRTLSWHLSCLAVSMILPLLRICWYYSLVNSRLSVCKFRIRSQCSKKGTLNRKSTMAQKILLPYASIVKTCLMLLVLTRKQRSLLKAIDRAKWFKTLNLHDYIYV